ncbi:MAG TPA: AAA family ATPase [Erysipelothrix sp.]|nr:AAA family ATPase [Erysipelothrix sp.]
MLLWLEIENYIIIDKIRIDFTKGMNVISGETGSGK